MRQLFCRARALNVAPKVASKQVARLEAALGVALFTRNTRNLRLTDEGEALRDKARSVLDGLAEMRELAQGADGMRGMIRLTAPAPFGRKYVAAAVADFSRRYPQVGFSLCLSDEVCNLFAGNFDLAIRMGELADSRLIARRIAVNRRILVASPAYLAEYGCPQSPAELSEHRCLRFAYPGLAADSWTLRNGDAEAVVRVSPHLSSDSGEVLHAWCMAGLGIFSARNVGCVRGAGKRQSAPRPARLANAAGWHQHRAGATRTDAAAHPALQRISHCALAKSTVGTRGLTSAAITISSVIAFCVGWNGGAIL